MERRIGPTWSGTRPTEAARVRSGSIQRPLRNPRLDSLATQAGTLYEAPALTIQTLRFSGIFPHILKVESSGLQFRAEFYNIFNHANFSDFGRTFGSPNFGQAIAARDARTIQLGLRLFF